MDINKIQALQDLQKALLSINGASRRLGINTEVKILDSKPSLVQLPEYKSLYSEHEARINNKAGVK